jgi:hypothetical protein
MYEASFKLQVFKMAKESNKCVADTEWDPYDDAVSLMSCLPGMMYVMITLVNDLFHFIMVLVYNFKITFFLSLFY